MRRVGLLVACHLLVAGCSLQMTGLGSDGTLEPLDGGEDTSAARDTGSEFDSSVTADTGEVDTSVVADTEPPPDTSVPADTAPPPDTFVPPDTGPFDTGPVDTAPPCTEPGAVAYAGHCYFVLATASAWSAARDGCVAAGAHLAVITSPEEQMVVGMFATGADRWVGLTLPAGATSFRWVDGTTISYANWDMGEPNGSGPCGRLVSSGRWRDTACNTVIAGICERE